MYVCVCSKYIFSVLNYQLIVDRNFVGEHKIIYIEVHLKTAPLKSNRCDFIAEHNHSNHLLINIKLPNANLTVEHLIRQKYVCAAYGRFTHTQSTGQALQTCHFHSNSYSQKLRCSMNNVVVVECVGSVVSPLPRSASINGGWFHA